MPQVVTWDYAPFSLAELLGTLGGSMGLWLGLGVAELIEIILAVPKLANTQDKKEKINENNTVTDTDIANKY